MEYIRKCPYCGKELKYKYKSTYEYAIKLNSNCKSCGKYLSNHKNDTIYKLLENTPEAFYWTGFILADGHIHDNRLFISLSIKDIDHLKKFCNFINCNIKTTTVKLNDKYFDKCYITIKDIKIINEFINKFNINSNKTINPPDSILKWNYDLLFALFCGFIDGDGNISNLKNRNDAFLRIKNHKNWINIFNEFNLLIDNKAIVKINSNDYALFTLTDFKVLKKIKEKNIKLNIPYMERKWDKVNLNYISKKEFIKNNLNNIINDISQLSRKEICDKYNIAQSTLSNIINKKRNYAE